MTQSEPPTLEQILPEALGFFRNFRSLLLATSDGDGWPNASYAAHVIDDQGRFYVYVSDLAAHTGNLKVRLRASVLFIENENDAQHLFARRRLTCDCRVKPLARETPEWETAMGLFIAAHGAFMAMLKNLEDFRMFQLTPERAVYVRGFAQAYELMGEQLSEIRHISDQGHRSAKAATLDSVA